MENGQYHLIYPDGTFALFFDPSATLKEVLEFAALYNQGREENRKIVEILSKEGLRKVDSLSVA